MAKPTKRAVYLLKEAINSCHVARNRFRLRSVDWDPKPWRLPWKNLLDGELVKTKLTGNYWLKRQEQQGKLSCGLQWVKLRASCTASDTNEEIIKGWSINLRVVVGKCNFILGVARLSLEAPIERYRFSRKNRSHEASHLKWRPKLYNVRQFKRGNN